MSSYYSGGGLAAGVAPGVTARAPKVPARVGSTGLAQVDTGPLWTVWSIAGLAATGALAYHGYRRNNSVGWALVWGLFGGLVWPIGVGLAAAQGFGKPRLRKNRLRRKRRSR